MNMLAKCMSLLLMAALAVACGGETTEKKTTASDAAATGDSASGSDTTAGTDAATGSDTTTGADAGAADAGKAPTYTTCPTLADCVLEACTPKKFEKGCETACLGDASKEALLPGAPLLTCAKDTCVPACAASKDPDCLNDCISTKCSGEFFTCVESKTHGKEICGSLLGCGEACQAGKTGQFVCLSKCFDAVTEDGKKEFKAMLACQAKGKDAECGKESIQCLTGGKTGSKKCVEGIPCAEKCDDEKTEVAKLSCVGKCAQEIDKASVGLFMQASGCGAEFEAGCGATLAACMAPAGSDKCGKIAGCVDACKDDDDACVQGCIMKGDSSSAAQFMEFALGCGADLPECGASYLTCTEPDGTATCGATIQCVSDCPEDAKEAACVLGCLAKSKKASAELLKPALTCGAKGDTSSDACKAALGKCVTDK